MNISPENNALPPSYEWVMSHPNTATSSNFAGRNIWKYEGSDGSSNMPDIASLSLNDKDSNNSDISEKQNKPSRSLPEGSTRTNYANASNISAGNITKQITDHSVRTVQPHSMPHLMPHRKPKTDDPLFSLTSEFLAYKSEHPERSESRHHELDGWGSHLDRYKVSLLKAELLTLLDKHCVRTNTIVQAHQRLLARGFSEADFTVPPIMLRIQHNYMCKIDEALRKSGINQHLDDRDYRCFHRLTELKTMVYDLLETGIITKDLLRQIKRLPDRDYPSIYGKEIELIGNTYTDFIEKYDSAGDTEGKKEGLNKLMGILSTCEFNKAAIDSMIHYIQTSGWRFPNKYEHMRFDKTKFSDNNEYITPKNLAEDFLNHYTSGTHKWITYLLSDMVSAEFIVAPEKLLRDLNSALSKSLGITPKEPEARLYSV